MEAPSRLLCRSITPALAQGSVLPCVATRPLAVPSPASGCQTKWNWSPVFQMSVPAPCTVQVPPFNDWSPTTMGLPTSAQPHPLGQGLGEGAGEGADPMAPAVTPSNVTVVAAPGTPESPAAPASTSVGSTSVAVAPGTSE